MVCKECKKQHNLEYERYCQECQDKDLLQYNKRMTHVKTDYHNNLEEYDFYGFKFMRPKQ